MIRKAILTIIILLGMFCENFCFQLREQDDSRIQFYPQKIISFGPFITEELFLLGIQDRLIGCTVYCNRPEQAKNKEKIGTALTVNLEKILSLKPDIVLATSLINLNAIKKLRILGIKVKVFPIPRSFNQICNTFLELAKIVGKEKKAKEILNEVIIKTDLIKNNTRGFIKTRVFFQVGAKPLFTITKNSFINDFIEFSGGINIAKDAGTGFYTREEVLRRNPDVIIIVTMGIIGEEEKKTWKKFKALNAVKNDRVFIVDSNKICSPTPVSFVEVLQEMVDLLHPSGLKNE